MSSSEKYGVFGYRFQEPAVQPIYQLYATGYEKMDSLLYEWDGMKRTDGPLYLFQYTVSGCGQLELGDQRFSVPAGTAFMVEIPGKHRYFARDNGNGDNGNDDENGTPWEFYFVLFRQQHLGELWSAMLDSLGPLPTFPMDSPVIRMLQLIYAEARHGRIEDVHQASSLVYQFMMELSRSRSAERRQRSSWPDKVQRAAAYMEQHYTRPESLDDIAAAAGSSKYHLTRTFAEATGMTLLAYMTRLRMEKATQLLRQSPLSVHEVALAVGYTSGSYFSKVFRSWTGFPPSEFREAQELPATWRFMFD
ncbi:hypothetical protein BBD42_17815 [Paenibacillus sp. BIHB 4019]|uniref:HTH araC/xylS-type domain-containing protein n=1 Tax=Paenibacillus sp. BIHB 4019 TaxID=1870819 RepID=A0A1B2DK73_9BACL|nr:hypothetical protein BBD42_17815 [Paenibacillus sp. BIHB 4019]